MRPQNFHAGLALHNAGKAPNKGDLQISDGRLNSATPRIVTVGFDREELPGSGNAFEYVVPTVAEVDSRPRHQVTHSTGDENLTCVGSPSNSGADMYGDASHVDAAKFNLTTVQTCADLDAQWSQRVSDRLRAANRTPRSVERGQYAIAG